MNCCNFTIFILSYSYLVFFFFFFKWLVGFVVHLNISLPTMFIGYTRPIHCTMYICTHIDIPILKGLMTEQMYFFVCVRCSVAWTWRRVALASIIQSYRCVQNIKTHRPTSWLAFCVIVAVVIFKIFAHILFSVMLLFAADVQKDRSRCCKIYADAILCHIQIKFQTLNNNLLRERRDKQNSNKPKKKHTHIKSHSFLREWEIQLLMHAIHKLNYSFCVCSKYF